MEVEVPGGPELDAIAFNVDLACWPDASVSQVSARVSSGY